MSAQNPASLPASIDGSPEPAPVDLAPLNGPLAANLGDGANGRLSEVFQLVENTPFTAPDGSVSGYVIGVDKWRSIRAELRSIVREHTERAWDEGFTLADRLWQGSEYNEVAWAPDLTANPYRKAQS